MLSCTSFTEKSIERVISTSDGLVTRHLAIRLDSVLQTIQLPARIANLAASLSNMDRNALALKTFNQSPAKVFLRFEEIQKIAQDRESFSIDLRLFQNSYANGIQLKDAIRFHSVDVFNKKNVFQTGEEQSAEHATKVRKIGGSSPGDSFLFDQNIETFASSERMAKKSAEALALTLACESVIKNEPGRDQNTWFVF